GSGCRFCLKYGIMESKKRSRYSLVCTGIMVWNFLSVFRKGVDFDFKTSAIKSSGTKNKTIQNTASKNCSTMAAPFLTNIHDPCFNSYDPWAVCQIFLPSTT